MRLFERHSTDHRALQAAFVGRGTQVAHTDGFEAFRQEEKRWAYWQDELPTTHPIATEVADTVDAFTNFDGITYGKGASVLKQLSFYVGEGAFRAGKREGAWTWWREDGSVWRQATYKDGRETR